MAVFFAVLFVACTSTTLLSGFHTQKIVDFVWKSVFGQWHASETGPLNWMGRKVGHFFGYGTIGLIFRRAWYNTLRLYVLAARAKLVFLSSIFGIASTFALAGLDEWHQMYLPQRHGSIYDALVDTLGALFLILSISTIRRVQRRRNADAVRIIRAYSKPYKVERAW